MNGNRTLIVICIWLSGCVSILFASSECPKTYIKSHDHGKTYPPNLNCSWLLTSSNINSIIQFTLVNLQLENVADVVVIICKYLTDQMAEKAWADIVRETSVCFPQGGIY